MRLLIQPLRFSSRLFSSSFRYAFASTSSRSCTPAFFTSSPPSRDRNEEELRPIEPKEVSDFFTSRVDFGTQAEAYGKDRAGFPARFFAHLQQHHCLPREGSDVLDIGTGTGTVARGLARTKRGPQGTGKPRTVVGLDPSPELLEVARTLTEVEQGQDPCMTSDVTYVEGEAESLPFADQSLDLVTAGQCWHWFKSKRAFQEVARVLRPDGRLVIAHFDWVPSPSSLAAMTEAVVLKYQPDWPMANGNGLYPKWVTAAVEAGYSDVDVFSFEIVVPYKPAAWRSRMQAMNAVITLPKEQQEAFDKQLQAVLSAGLFNDERLPDGRIGIKHRVWALVATPPPSP